MSATNPFPAPPIKPFPVSSPFKTTAAAPGVWAAPPAAATAPPGTAIDKTTGEILLDENGKPLTCDELLLLWKASQTLLEDAKSSERTLRDKVVAVFTDPSKNKGTENIPLGNGWGLKVAKSIRYSLKSKREGIDDYHAVLDAVDKMQATGPVGELIAQRLVKFSADLSVKEYGLLPPDLKAIIDEVVITTDGAPTVDIIPPKESK